MLVGRFRLLQHSLHKRSQLVGIQEFAFWPGQGNLPHPTLVQHADRSVGWSGAGAHPQVFINSRGADAAVEFGPPVHRHAASLEIKFRRSRALGLQDVDAANALEQFDNPVDAGSSGGQVELIGGIGGQLQRRAIGQVPFHPLFGHPIGASLGHGSRVVF